MHQKTIKYIIIFVLVLAILHTALQARHFPLHRDILLNHYRVTLQKGEKFTLKAYTVSLVSYRSDNFRVASVTSGGTVYANRKGTAYIRVSAKKQVSYCRVRVR